MSINASALSVSSRELRLYQSSGVMAVRSVVWDRDGWGYGLIDAGARAETTRHCWTEFNGPIDDVVDVKFNSNFELFSF